MLAENLTKPILFEPMLKGADRLCIIAGYATPNMASWFMKNIPENVEKKIDISLIVGMVPYDGLSISIHEGFKELMHSELPKNIGNFQCSYICDNAPVHSKVYIWLKDEEPIIAYCGSANFTQMGFSRERREIMTLCNPIEAYDYYNQIEGDSIYCNHGEIEEYIMLYPLHDILDRENHPTASLSGAGIESLNLSLLSRNGEVGGKSGLNWGQRTYRNRNEAYIGLPSKHAHSGFFPLGKRHFTVLTDDGHQLILRVEQENDKAITTPLCNARLGEYFRKRLKLANGAYVVREDLENYGRTDVTFYKFDDEQYYMDFSVRKDEPNV